MAFMGVGSTKSCINLHKTLKFFPQSSLFSSSKLLSASKKVSTFTPCAAQSDAVHSQQVEVPSLTDKKINNGFNFSGLEDVITGYIFGKKKSTEVAHAVWKNVVRKGDAVIDATCGNGFDTLAMLRLVADDTHRGRVYAMDLQKHAIESTSSLLDQSVTADERELVELYAMCHTKMEEIIPPGDAARLVAFNLGYLPGGDKRIKTEFKTTLVALQAAERILARGGLISIVAYLGHSGGREEFEIVQSFAAGLPVDNWVCSKLQMLNRPFAPVLVFLYKK